MRISMPRGDIKWQRFLINTPNGTATDIDFTSIYFTVKKKASDRQYLFQKSLKRGEIYKLGPGDYQLKIEAADTNKLMIGEYKFDIQIAYKNLLKESFVGDFVIKDEVTFYENEDEEEEEVDYTLPQTSEKSAVIVSVPDYHLLEMATPVTITGADGDYNNLSHLPTINGVPVKGDLTLEDLGIQPAGSYASEALTFDELEEIISEENDAAPLTPDELDEIISNDENINQDPEALTEEDLDELTGD